MRQRLTNAVFCFTIGVSTAATYWLYAFDVPVWVLPTAFASFVLFSYTAHLKLRNSIGDSDEAGGRE